MGADLDKRESFNFYQLLRAVELRIIAIENAKRIAVLLEEDALNIQLIQELRQQRNELYRRREERLLNLVGPVVYGGPLVQSPTMD